MNDVPAVSRFRLATTSPLKLGLGIGGVLLIAFLAWETAFGQWPGIMDAARAGALSRQPTGILRDFRIAVVHVLLMGYLPAALLAVVQGGRRTVFELQGALDCTDQECAAIASSVRLGSTGLLVAGLIGLLAGFATPYIVPPVPEALWHPQTWSPEVVWHRVLGPIATMWVGWLLYAVVSVSSRMSRLAAGLSTVDLLELRPLQPFTQQGLTNALLVLGFVSIAGLMVVTEEGFGLLGLLWVLPTLLASGAAFLLPVRGVHARIRQAKADELMWVDERIRSGRTSLKAATSGETPGTLADLAAYRGLVREIPDWPIGTSSYARFALYLLIPLLSWAAAALVERIVNAVVF